MHVAAPHVQTPWIAEGDEGIVRK